MPFNVRMPLEKQYSAINSVIEATGSSRSVTASDRDAYELWLGWGFDHAAILAAARAVAGRPMAFGAIAKILSDCRDAKAFGADDVASRAAMGQGAKEPKRAEAMEHKYTGEELASFFGDIRATDDWGV